MQSSESEGLWKDGSESLETSVVCVKCSEWYSIPDDYECHDTDFGAVVIKVGFRTTDYQ